MKLSRIYYPILLLVVLTICSCSSDEEKKIRHFEKGKAYYEKGEYKEAVLELKNALQIDPKYSEAYYMLGLTSLKQKDFKEAFTNFSRAVEFSPDNLEARLELSKLFLAGKAIDKAQEAVDDILKSDLTNREDLYRDAVLVKSSVLIAKKDIKTAIECLEEALTKGVNDDKVYVMLAALYAGNKDIENAGRVLEMGADKNPDSVALLTALFKLQSRYGKLEDAEKTQKRLIRLEPNNVIHKLNLAGLYFNSGRQEEANDLLEDIASHPGDEQNMLLLSRFYISKRRFNDAEKIIKTGLNENKNSIKLRLLLSRLYSGLKKSESAIDVLKRSLEIAKDPSSPDNIKVKNELARIYLSTGDIENAIKWTDEALKGNPKSYESHFYKGIIYSFQGEIKQSISEFNMVVEERPDFVNGYIFLARSHITNLDLAKAEVTLWKGLRIMPESRRLLLAYSRVFAMKKDYENAALQLNKILDRNPNDIEAISNLGNIYMAQNDFNRAKSEFTKIKQKAPKNSLGYQKLSQLYAIMGESSKAVSELENGYETIPESNGLFVNLIRGYVSNEKYDTAIRALTKRINQNPEEVFLYNLIGQTYMARKDYANAEKNFKKAIELEPTLMLPYNSLASLYLIQGRKDHAINTLESVITNNPEQPMGYMALGRFYEQTQEYQKAIKIYEEGYKVNPNLGHAANNISFLLCEHFDSKENLEKAFELAKKALRLMPKNPDVRDTLGWVYYKMGDFKSATNYLKMAYAGNPRHALINYHLGMALYKENMLEESLQKLENALSAKENFNGKEQAEKTRDLIITAMKSSGKGTPDSATKIKK